jgi:hypothetical protein
VPSAGSIALSSRWEPTATLVLYLFRLPHGGTSRQRRMSLGILMKRKQSFPSISQKWRKLCFRYRKPGQTSAGSMPVFNHNATGTNARNVARRSLAGAMTAKLCGLLVQIAFLFLLGSITCPLHSYGYCYDTYKMKTAPDGGILHLYSCTCGDQWWVRQ